MKCRSGILWIVLLLLVSCTDEYDGEIRYVIEGTFLDGIEVVANEEVRLFSRRSSSYKEAGFKSQMQHFC